MTAVLELQMPEDRPGKPSRKKDAQERTCAVSREQCDPSGLIRFAAGPDGNIVPDLKRKLPGRGVWVTASAAMVAQAVKRNVFAKSLKRPVQVDPGLADQVDSLLGMDALQSLSMTNKAGLVVFGAFQVEKLFRGGMVAAVIEARDGSPDGARKINQALFRHLGDAASDVPRVEIFDSGQLGLALGQTNVIHAALRQGAAADAFLARVRRLANFRADGDRKNLPKLQTVKARCDENTRSAEAEDK